MELRRPFKRSTSVKHITLENMPTNQNSLQGKHPNTTFNHQISFFIGDLIQMVKLVSIDFFQIKIVLLYLKFVAVITLLLELTQTYLFLQKFEILFLIQYGPSYIVTLFVRKNRQRYQNYPQLSCSFYSRRSQFHIHPNL